ncbi:MAG: helix-turn-helix transcriptional regulator [Bacilli bacterium]|nr:helix-turn-helix transcriptional regulator [Bacilli bacterium]
MKLRDVFIKNMIKYRKEANLSQEKLAELSDLSTNYIGEIERNTRKVSIDTIEKIAIGLNVKPNELLDSDNIK